MAVCTFEHGRVHTGGWCLPVFQFDKRSVLYEKDCCRDWIRDHGNVHGSLFCCGYRLEHSKYNQLVHIDRTILANCNQYGDDSHLYYRFCFTDSRNCLFFVGYLFQIGSVNSKLACRFSSSISRTKMAIRKKAAVFCLPEGVLPRTVQNTAAFCDFLFTFYFLSSSSSNAIFADGESSRDVSKCAIAPAISPL